MLIYPFVMLMVFIMSLFAFSKLKYMVVFEALTGGIVLLLNDWNATATGVNDSIVKLSFLLLFIMWCWAAWYNVWKE